MKLTHILPITTALLAIALPSPLLAAKGAKKPKDPVKEAIGAALNLYDKDSDRAITGDESKAVRDAFAADKTGPLKALDTNTDGTLDDAEIAATQKKGKGGKGKKKDAAAPAPDAPALVAPAAPATEKKAKGKKKDAAAPAPDAPAPVAPAAPAAEKKAKGKKKDAAAPAPEAPAPVAPAAPAAEKKAQ